jgi:biopolymer transport protein ExbD
MDTQTPFMPHEEKKSLWGLPLVFVLLAVLVLVVIVFVVRRQQVSQLPVPAKDSATKERVQVTQFDTTTNQSDKLPNGFPQGVPVETATITESIRSEYADRQAVQLQVSFLSQRGPVELFSEYQDYMTRESWDFGSQGLNPEAGSLYGTKEGDDLSVVISSAGTGSGTLVQIGYLDRQ